MLPFDPRHLPPVRTSSIGSPTGFGENFVAGMNLQRQVESQRAVPMRLSERFTENLERARDLSGEELDFAPLFDTQWTEILEARRQGKDWEGMAFSFERDLAKKFKELQEKLKELKRTHPEIKTFDEIGREVAEELQAQRGEQAELYARGDWKAVLGALAGGMVGSFDPTSDPLNFMSLFAPGAGATAFRRILMEAVIGAGTEAAVQGVFVQRRQKALGIEPVNPWASIALAGAGAAAFRGIAFEGAPAAARVGERLIAPQRARARIFSNTMDEALRLPSDRAPTPTELLAAARRVPQTPEVRAAQFSFELDQITLRDIPDSSPEGFRQWRVEVEDAVRTVEGILPTEDIPRGRFTDPQSLPVSETAPRSKTERLFHATTAPVGARIEARLPPEPPAGSSGQQPLGVYLTTKAGVQSYNKGGRSRVEEFDVDTTDFVDITEAIKYRRKKKGMTFGQAKLAAIEAKRANAPGIIYQGDSVNPREVIVFDQTRLRQLSLEPVEPRPPLASELAVNSRTKAVAEVEAVSVLEEARLERAEAWFERVQAARGEVAEGETPPVVAEPRPTSVDIGTDRPIDLDQLIDFTDENGLTKQATVRELLDDMAEDDFLFNYAKKECLL